MTDWQPAATTVPDHSRQCLVWVETPAPHRPYPVVASFYQSIWRGPEDRRVDPTHWCEIVGPDDGRRLNLSCRCTPQVLCCGWCGWIDGEGYPAQQAEIAEKMRRNNDNSRLAVGLRENVGT